MPTLQTIRQAPRLIRAVLAWFVLSVGLAVAAPLVAPQSLSLVCSAAGSFKLVASDGQGDASGPGAPGAPSAPFAGGHHTLDCVLCLALSAPPSASAQVVVTAALPLATAPGVPIAPMAWRTAAPLPARGPPARA